MNLDTWYIKYNDCEGIYKRLNNKYINVLTGEELPKSLESDLHRLENEYGASSYFYTLVNYGSPEETEGTKLKLSSLLLELYSRQACMIPFIHIKTGKRYYVHDVLPNCTNDTEWDCIVVYKRDNGSNVMYARQLSEFLKKFKYEY